MDIDEAINLAGYGPFHHVLLLLSGCGFAASTIELVLPSLLLPVLIQEWRLSSTIGGLLMMGTFGGEVVGGLVWARVSDRLGRRVAYVGTALSAAVCALAGCVCANFAQLLVSRILLGVALGGSMSIDFVYFMEFMPTHKRGSRATMIILVGIAGLFVVGALGPWVLPVFGWRAFVLAGALPTVVLAAGRLLWRWESPRFLLYSGRVEQAERVLEVMSRRNGCHYKPTLHIPVADLTSGDYGQHNNNGLQQQQSLLQLLAPTIAPLAAIFTLHTFAYYGMTTWFSKFAAHYNVTRVGHAKGLMLIAAAEVPGLYLSRLLIDRCGRRVTLAMNLLGAAVSVALFSVIPTTTTYFLAVSCSSYFFIVGVWAVLYVSGPELFPTHLRSTAFAVCATAGKLGGFVSPLMFGRVWDGWREPMPAARNIVAGSFMAAAVVAMVFMRETMGESMH
jgi:MFS family permease